MYILLSSPTQILHGSIFISTISGTMLSWVIFFFLYWNKNTLENEGERGNTEIWGVRGRPIAITLHFPFLSLLSFFLFNPLINPFFLLTFISFVFIIYIALIYIV
jgi:hypothetical protein